MSENESVESIARRLAQAIPENLRAAGQDIEQHLRTALGAGLERMNLVTREEFEVQQAVLQRTRARLEALEKTLAAMESEQT